MNDSRRRDIQTLAAQIEQALAPLAEIRLAYLFGSRHDGRHRDDSDLDVAVAFATGRDEAQRGRFKLAVIAALTDQLGAIGERADVVDLDRSSSAVAFRAIRDGLCVFERAPFDRSRAEARVARRYDDDAPMRALFAQAAERIAAEMAKGA